MQEEPDLRSGRLIIPRVFDRFKLLVIYYTDLFTLGSTAVSGYTLFNLSWGSIEVVDLDFYAFKDIIGF